MGENDSWPNGMALPIPFKISYSEQGKHLKGKLAH
jgi:hypothetical protein